MNPELAVDPDGNATVAWEWAPLATGTAGGSGSQWQLRRVVGPHRLHVN